MQARDQILGTTLVLVAVALLSKTAGFFREVFVAARFGTSQEADVFVAVFTLPTLVLTVLGGALSAALIPMIIRLHSQGETERLRRLISSVFSLTTLLLVPAAILLYLFVDQFTNVYVVGFSPEAKATTAQLIRIVLPALVAIGVVSFFTSVLNAYRSFVVPSLGPVFYSLGVIVAAVFFAGKHGVKSLIIGLVLGVFIQLAILILNGFKRSVPLVTPGIWWNDDLKQVGRLVLPIFIGVGVFQLNVVVDRMMASTLAEGSLAALNYAYRVTQLPLSLFVASMVIPLYPLIAEKISERDVDSAKELLGRSYHLLGILLLPVTGVFVALAEPIVAVIFQRGEFGARGVEMTGLALAFYAFSILPYAMRDVITRAMYALQDTWTPVINSVLLFGLNIGLMIVFVPKLGMIGIAGAYSFSFTLAYIRLRHQLIKKIGKIGSKEEQRTWLKIWCNALVFTVVTWGSYQGLMALWSAPAGMELYLRTFFSLGAGGLVYMYLTFRLDTPEVAWLRARLRLPGGNRGGKGEGYAA